MLYEPGPLALFTDAQIPRSGARPAFDGLAAREASELLTAATNLSSPQGVFAAATGDVGELRAGADLLAAVDENDRQSRETDSAIGAVSGGAGTLEGELAGLTSDLAHELEGAAVPPTPPGPEERGEDDWTDPEYGSIITEWYQKLLGRDPEPGIIDGYRNSHASLVRVFAGIIGSEEYQARQGELAAAAVLGGGAGFPTSPRPTGGSSGGGGGGGGGGGIEWDVLAAYADRNPNERGRIEDFLRGNKGDDHRAPDALDLPGWDEFERNHGEE